KKNVGILSITAVGNYALQISFDDQHNSGIYSWAYLFELCEKKELYWQNYLNQLQDSGKNRDPDINIIRLCDPN
ncbi:MAG TPA: 1-(5-phosphoribosyl)-5-((5-phosphoribosylamino)methylideneamino)imidazole-4-carboxamide isomerase, partial [Cellvibrionales bacterium]|nr:1-(5-phosphoribosyl)-5-((5-phosphoribosylamino)methylideneamino)imidazole-4-carboxamide isomerase [Cellvibrionales bacterium]